MSEYWKSVPRKFCDFCKCWLTDNKPSIEFHERGKRHQESVARKLAELRKKGKKDHEAKRKMDKQFQKMNEAAMQAYQKDIERDPSLAREFDEAQKAAESTATSLDHAKQTPAKAPPIRDTLTTARKQKAFSRHDVTADSVDREVDPSQPYGQWVTIEQSSTGPIDLQLPEQKPKVEYKVVAQPAEDKFKFKEKTVTSLAATSKGDSTFRKRKFNVGTMLRNVRRKEANDAE